MPKSSFLIPNGIWWSVDTGLNTGIAWWNGNDLHGYSLVETSGKNWDEQADSFVAKLDQILDACTPMKVFYESPSYFGAGMGKVAAQSGSLVKLSVIVGILRGSVTRRGIDVQKIEVRDWKGQMSKQATKQRVEKRLAKQINEVDHIIDAIGIGLYVRGVW